MFAISVMSSQQRHWHRLQVRPTRAATAAFPRLYSASAGQAQRVRTSRTRNRHTRSCRTCSYDARARTCLLLRPLQLLALRQINGHEGINVTSRHFRLGELDRLTNGDGHAQVMLKFCQQVIAQRHATVGVCEALSPEFGMPLLAGIGASVVSIAHVSVFVCWPRSERQIPSASPAGGNDWPGLANAPHLSISASYCCIASTSSCRSTTPALIVPSCSEVAELAPDTGVERQVREQH